MPKTEAPRHVRLTDQVEAQQLVERVERSSRWSECGSRGELGVKGVARYRRTLEHEACSIGEKRDLLREGGGDECRSAELTSAASSTAVPGVAGWSSDRASCSR